ncbi:MAG: Gfo/Idh/MocA family protein [Marinosulfonomonas sp.]
MSQDSPDPDTYALRAPEVAEIEAPILDYKPPAPKSYSPNIGVIGAGGIVPSHLQAYRDAGWTVSTICNRTLSRAQDRADEFYPDAHVTDRYQEVLEDSSIDVVDITPHPAERLPMIEAALKAGKHVLSQKPFVLDLADGQRLVDLAAKTGCKLAVNQNGRWSPHMAWMRQAVRAGLIGDVLSAHVAVHWDHSWIAGTEFEKIEDVILYDFGIHWFDFINSLVPGRAQSVYASSTRGIGQKADAPLFAQAQLRLDRGQASLVFDGGTPFGPKDTTYIAGTKGSLVSEGPDLGQQVVTLTTEAGRAVPVLEGTWFNDGFRGAMGALLVAIGEDSEPENGAAENLKSLALAFAAIESRRVGTEIRVGQATQVKI